ncbi:MAG TPA: tyrosine recombinase XerD, partial [Parabacteroides sp.]|nr:tyrosine recombinase XerD [Parabacteroides sp.]
MESLNDALLNKYVTYLKIEKSLSLNTVEAYLRDLQKLMDYVAFEKLDVLHVTYEDLEQFLAQLWD